MVKLYTPRGVPAREKPKTETEASDDATPPMEELLAPDQFQEASGGVAEWLAERQSIFFGALGVALVVPLIYLGARTMMRSGEEKAAATLISALRPLEIPVLVIPEGTDLPGLDTKPRPDGLPRFYRAEKERIDAAQPKLKEFVAANGGSSLGALARITLARTMLDDGKPDEALAELESAAKDPAIAERYLFLALELQGQAWEQKGDLGKALEYYTTQATLPIGGDYGHYNKGRILAQSGKRDEAKSAFDQVITGYPDSPLKSEAERRMKAL